jgi:transcriptional regulator with XRE-family HTH domain
MAGRIASKSGFFFVVQASQKEAMAINVRRARNAKKMTQEDLADRAGLSTRYLRSVERGAVSTSVTVLGQIAHALRVDPCELIRLPRRKRTRTGP